MRVGLIKAVPERWNLPANWRTFVGLADSAAGSGADIVVTPECFLDGYVAPEVYVTGERSLASVAQVLDGDGYIARLRDYARDRRLHVLFGFTELVDGSCYNAAVLVDDTGWIAGCYHKTHLLDHDTVYLPGDALPVFETRLGRIGVMICADRRWPEVPRTLRYRGAEIILNPSYGMWHLDNEWWMRTRSYENEIFICFVHPNVSLVLGPEGGLDAKLTGDDPAVCIHDIDLSHNLDVMFRHRRPDIYDLV